MKSQAKKPGIAARVFGFVVVIGLVLALVGLGVFGISKLFASSASAKYTSSIEAIIPVSATQAKIIFTVQNVGKIAGKPDCTVNLQNPSGSDLGVDSVQFVSLSPGKAFQGSDTITVSNNGANAVTPGSSTVKCS
ncbi:MAG: hypothetical protein ACYDHP_00535 [Ferrimicrobium sp.]